MSCFTPLFTASQYQLFEIMVVASVSPEQISTIIRAPARAASIDVLGNPLFNSGLTRHNDTESQQTLHSPVPYMPSDALQMASIMQQVDELRAEVARLRQSQAGRAQNAETTGGASETGSLPDYTSMDERLRLQGAVVHHASPLVYILYR